MCSPGSTRVMATPPAANAWQPVDPPLTARRHDVPATALHRPDPQRRRQRLWQGVEHTGDTLQRHYVTVDTEPADHRGRHGREPGMMVGGLARMDVGNVQLDNRSI